MRVLLAVTLAADTRRLRPREMRACARKRRSSSDCRGESSHEERPSPSAPWAPKIGAVLFDWLRVASATSASRRPSHAFKIGADNRSLRFQSPAAIPVEARRGGGCLVTLKCAFPTAATRHRGPVYFQASRKKGTLFIDEVGSSRCRSSEEVLRALQSGDVQPVGCRG